MHIPDCSCGCYHTDLIVCCSITLEFHRQNGLTGLIMGLQFLLIGSLKTRAITDTEIARSFLAVIDAYLWTKDNTRISIFTAKHIYTNHNEAPPSNS